MKKLTLIVLLGLGGNATYAALAIPMAGATANGIAPARAQSSVVGNTNANSPPTMHQGVITALDLGKGEISVHRNLLRFDRSTVRVFTSSGGQAMPSMMRAGQQIRFLLDPKEGNEKWISVIYLQ